MSSFRWQPRSAWAVLPWSPLGGGVLTGKYARSDVVDARDASIASTRKGVIASSGHLNARSIEVADVVRAVAEEVGATPSQVAIAWTLANPAVTSPVMGARTLAQAKDNLGALKVALSPEHVDRLNQASAPDPIFPVRFVGRPMVQQLIFGGASVARRD
jgi:aryl-alcohol dehydrogenase-like predicted oxidoreductase